MAKSIVKCIYCGKSFDREKISCAKIGRRYAHVECADKVDEKTQLEEKSKQALFDYIKELFGDEAKYPTIQKLLTKYINDYNYTYSGILKSLKYWYEVKHNSTKDAKGSIGIVEYVYQDAFNYYYSIWLANQKNEAKGIENYQPKERLIKIPPPEKKIKKRNLFTFLDDEE